MTIELSPKDKEFLEALQNDVKQDTTDVSDLNDLFVCPLNNKKTNPTIQNGGGVWTNIKSFFCSKKVIPINKTNTTNPSKKTSLVSRHRQLMYVQPNNQQTHQQCARIPYHMGTYNSRQYQYQNDNTSYTPLQYCTPHPQLQQIPSGYVQLPNTQKIQPMRVQFQNTEQIPPGYVQLPNARQYPSKYKLPPIEKMYITPTQNTTVLYDALSVKPILLKNNNSQKQTTPVQDPFIFNLDMNTMSYVFHNLKNELGDEAYKAMINFQLTCKNFQNMYNTEVKQESFRILKNNLKNLIEYTINMQEDKLCQIELIFAVKKTSNDNNIFVVTVTAEERTINEDLLYEDVWKSQYTRFMTPEQNINATTIRNSIDRNQLSSYFSYKSYNERKTSKMRVNIGKNEILFDEYIRHNDDGTNSKTPGYVMVKLDVAETIAQYITDYLQQQKNTVFTFLTPVINNETTINHNYWNVNTVFNTAVLDLVAKHNSDLVNRYRKAKAQIKKTIRDEEIERIQKDISILLVRLLSLVIEQSNDNKETKEYYPIKFICKLGAIYIEYLINNNNFPVEYGDNNKDYYIFNKFFPESNVQQKTRIKSWFLENKDKVLKEHGWRWMAEKIPDELLESTSIDINKNFDLWVQTEIQSWKTMFNPYITEQVFNRLNFDPITQFRQFTMNFALNLERTINKKDSSLEKERTEIKNNYHNVRNEMLEYIYNNRGKIASELTGGCKKSKSRSTPKCKPSPLTIEYKGKKRTIYIGPRGGKYIKQKDLLIPLISLKF